MTWYVGREAFHDRSACNAAVHARHQAFEDECYAAGDDPALDVAAIRARHPVPHADDYWTVIGRVYAVPEHSVIDAAPYGSGVILRYYRAGEPGGGIRTLYCEGGLRGQLFPDETVMREELAREGVSP